MATINPTVITAYNPGSQDLFTIEYPFANVPQYVSVGSTAALTFSTLGTSIGTDASIDNETGEITLQADVTFSITVHADPSTTTPSSYKFVNEGDNEIEGLPAPIGDSLVLTITPAVESVYQVIAYTNNGSDWGYPSQIQNATIIIQAIAGYEA